MTTLEFSNEFDIHYNSIAGQSAPGLDAYEKSVYFTKAQLEIVKDYYDALSNRKQKGFEATEKRRNDLKELVRPFNSSTSFTNTRGIHSSSRFFTIPSDVFLIVYEAVKITSADCFNNSTIEVRPVTHDEFNTQIRNPFKTPDGSVAWRLDLSDINNLRVVEIVSPYNVTGQLEYRMRYIKYPKPIIIDDLTTTYPSESLTIDGISAQTECELKESIHREIVDRAVELALRDYKIQGLESKIQLDARNE